ncbi:MAG: CPBP family intramembrane metalloprotease [Candidatus Aminicenantes bacterium]|nr:CPBP family intramembrane metalloprotease [Candidatus Aminicenantes bacterium]
MKSLIENKKLLIETGAFGAGMLLFALFIHSKLPLLFFSYAGLLLAAVILGRIFFKETNLLEIFGLSKLSAKVLLISFVGLLFGAAIGVQYRLLLGSSILPRFFSTFVLLSALIGITEELLYRGYVQGRVKPFGPIFAIGFAALLHSGYKVFLFILPPAGVSTDLLSLALYTLWGGLGFGILREISGSVLPPLLAHAAFDIIVYAEYAKAPWWVWS